jgi:alpha-tubulin suppressor-like RCC1 family protein
MMDAKSILDVRGGRDWTLILFENGTVYSRGKNNVGQLGLGDLIDRLTLVHIPSAINVTKIAAHFQNSMYLRLGKLYGVGNNVTSSIFYFLGWKFVFGNNKRFSFNSVGDSWTFNNH